MSRFREESTIETKYHACPICASDVKGNDVYKFLCTKCHILFRREDLIMTSEGVGRVLKEKIAKKMLDDSNQTKIELEQIKEKTLSQDKKDLLDKNKDTKNLGEYFISLKSNVLHTVDCHFGKNVDKKNRMYVKSLDSQDLKDKKIKKCRCIKKLRK